MTLRNRMARLRPALAPVTLAMLTACLMTPAAPASAGDVDFKHGMQVGLATVTSVDGVKRPVEFAVSEDGDMWEFDRVGSFWTRTNRGTPKADGRRVEILAGAGAVGVGQGVRSYVVGEDGNLWEFKHDGGSIGWTKLPLPGNSVKLVGAVGTEVGGDGARFVVVRDKNDRLWQYKNVKGDWKTEDMGKMPAVGDQVPAKDAGLGTFGGGAYAFTISNRNVLWSVHKTLDDKWTWISWGTGGQGDPVWSSLGVISYREQNELQVFLQADNGRVWRVSWDEAVTSGAWKEFAAPAFEPAVGRGGGAVAIPGGEQVTVLGKDGKLRNTINGHTPSAPWYGTITPQDADLFRELGSRNVSNDTYTFTVDEDGDVWVARFTPGDLGWKWKEILG